MNDKTMKCALTALALAGTGLSFAMPTMEELRAAEPVVLKLLASERQDVAAGRKSRADVAQVALAQAGKTASAAEKFLLLKGAFSFLVRDARFREAAEVLKSIRQAVPDLTAYELVAIIETALRTVPEEKGGQFFEILLGAQARAKYADSISRLGDVKDSLYADVFGGAKAAPVPATPAPAAEPVRVTPGPASLEKVVTLPGGARMTFCWCPAGEAVLAGRLKGRDVRFTTGSKTGFWIGKYEVTQRQWASVMGDNPSRFKGDDRPVDSVSWKDARDFVEKVKAGGVDVSLPTKSRWIYAVTRGLDGKWPTPEETAEMAWYKPNAGGQTHPVGTRRANALGVHDMLGNVWEYCQDASKIKENGEEIDFAPAIGGSWVNDEEFCHPVANGGRKTDVRASHYGLRLMMEGGDGREISSARLRSFVFDEGKLDVPGNYVLGQTADMAGFHQSESEKRLHRSLDCNVAAEGFAQFTVYLDSSKKVCQFRLDRNEDDVSEALFEEVCALAEAKYHVSAYRAKNDATTPQGGERRKIAFTRADGIGVSVYFFKFANGKGKVWVLLSRSTRTSGS